MVIFFKTPANSIIATQADHQLTADEQKELSWLYNNAELIDNENLEGFYVGPRREMITPWSTNAVEITQNMGLKGITRIEEYYPGKQLASPISSWRQGYLPVIKLFELLR